jgi:hypothetical protein
MRKVDIEGVETSNFSFGIISSFLFAPSFLFLSAGLTYYFSPFNSFDTMMLPTLALLLLVNTYLCRAMSVVMDQPIWSLQSNSTFAGPSYQFNLSALPPQTSDAKVDTFSLHHHELPVITRRLFKRAPMKPIENVAKTAPSVQKVESDRQSRIEANQARFNSIPPILVKKKAPIFDKKGDSIRPEFLKELQAIKDGLKPSSKSEAVDEGE